MSLPSALSRHYMEIIMIDHVRYDTYTMLEIKIEELDFVKTPAVSDAIHKLLVEIGYPNIILDLQNLYYIDSTGLSTLINMSRKIKDNGNEMVVVCSTTKILQLFEIAKVDNFFRIFKNYDDAVAHFAAHTA